MNVIAIVAALGMIATVVALVAGAIVWLFFELRKRSYHE